jgi:hypothetical protein
VLAELVPRGFSRSAGLPNAPQQPYSRLVRRPAEDTSPQAERVLIDLLRRASPARKCRMIVSANLAGRALALAGLRARYPLESPEQLRRRLADLWLGPELAAKAYGRLVPDERA